MHISEGEEPNRTAMQEGNTPAIRDSPNAQTREGVEDDEYVIDRIVNNALDEDEHKLRYRVRWYGHLSQVHTWEALDTLPRWHMVHYHGTKKLPLPATLVDALVGLLLEMLDMDALDH